MYMNFHILGGQRETGWWSIKMKRLLFSYWSRRELPSLARTNKPPSPLDIRKSLSRYVVISQELVLSPGMGILRGDWPEMTRDMFATTFSRGPRDCSRGPRLSCWPKMFMFSGRSILDFISGGCSDPSLNVTCFHLEMLARVSSYMQSKSSKQAEETND